MALPLETTEPTAPPVPESTVLGICIPVYKRPELLAGCLDSAIDAAAPWGVPIFISDDSADDTNAAVLERAAARYPYLHVNRNPANIGIDRNIARSVDLCTCRHAWMIGEDDRFRPHAVARVLALLAQGRNPAFVFVNYSHVTADYGQVFMERRIPLREDVHLPAGAFLREWSWASGFIGGCVVETRRWRATSVEPYLGTYFAHVGRIMAFSAGTEVAVVAEPLVLNRAGNLSSYTWAAQAFEVYDGFERLIELLVPIYGRGDCDAALESCRKAFRHRTLKWLILTRAENVYDLGVYRRRRIGQGKSSQFRAAAVLIALLPPPVSRLVRWVGRDLPRRLLGGRA